MRYYFQRPPVKTGIAVKILENQDEQSVTFFLFEIQPDEEQTTEVLLTSRTFFIADIFAENFYALVPVRDNEILTPVNMDAHRGKVGVTEHLKRVYQLDDFICYIIFGSEPTLEKTSLLALYDFQFAPGEIANKDKYIDFYDSVAMAVDDPVKIRLDAEKRKTILSISSNDVLTGLEAQLDILSHIVIELVEGLASLSPKLREEILRQTPLEKFRQVYQDTAVTGLKDMDAALEEVKKQKSAVRKEQSRYFHERDRIYGKKQNTE